MDSIGSSPLDTAQIGGVRIHSTDRDQLLTIFSAWLGSERARFIFYVNAHCLNIAATQPEYRQILNRADLVYADGVGVQWASRFLGQCRLYKVTGREWIYAACETLERQRRSLYILAGKPGVARKAAERLRSLYNKLDIVGVADGYFSEMSEQAVLDDIARKCPDVLLVGMGVPRQEYWVDHNRNLLPVRICWGVGALFDLIAGLEQEVPGWLDRLSLEWVWRLWIDPTGKWQRYLIGNPKFVLRVIAERWGLNH